MLEPEKIKLSSECVIRSLGGEVLQWLPTIDPDEIALRSSLEVGKRALILNVLVHMSFGMPSTVGKEWLEAYGLLGEASQAEHEFLDQKGPLEEKTRSLLRWEIEPLWAAVWTGSLTTELSPTRGVGDELASLLPDLAAEDTPEAFLNRFTLRSLPELYAQLDLFYRAHWFARDSHLHGRDAGAFNLGIVQDRRKLLEWVTHADSQWDDIDMPT